MTSAAQSDVKTVAAAAQSPSDVRASLFAATPLIVGDYIDGSAALALDWYEELRSMSTASHAFRPSPLTLVTDADVKAMVAAVTADIQEFGRQIDAEAEQRMAVMIDEVAAGVQRQVASGFWDTVTGNVANDPDTAGWQRFARAGACKFCEMLAGRGAVYSRETVNFAAHTSCHCVVGPSYDPNAPKADAIQYVASKKQRTAKERADLRDYLNHHFPDAPG